MRDESQSNKIINILGRTYDIADCLAYATSFDAMREMRREAEQAMEYEKTRLKLLIC